MKFSAEVSAITNAIVDSKGYLSSLEVKKFLVNNIEAKDEQEAIDKVESAVLIYCKKNSKYVYQILKINCQVFH